MESRPNIKEGIVVCLDNIGVIVNDLNLRDDLNKFLPDSISYISFIVELEQYFDIEIPDEYLVDQSIQNFEDIKLVKGGKRCEKSFKEASKVI